MIDKRKKALVNVQAFLPDDKEIVSILNACDMSPADDWRLWINGESPSIRIYHNKKIMCRKRNVETPGTIDLYFGSHPTQLAELSKLALIIFVANVMCILLFLGKDNKLRLARYLDKIDEWQRDYPLTLPLEDVRTLIKHEGVETHRRVSCYGSSRAIGWVTPWPPSRDLLIDFDKKDKEIWNNPARSLISDFSST